jgi:UDP-3-O-acyl N-acetylglucosamine deacetylase
MAKGRILIVDDEASIVRALEGILADEGFDVVHADAGEAALQLIQAQPIDLVLLDIWMPGMDGIQTLQRMKALQSSVCVIVMSGHGNIETAVKATRLGAFDYLEKPLSLDNVLSSVNAAFDHRWKGGDHHGVDHLPPHTVEPVGNPVGTASQGEYASLKEARRAWERQYLVEQLRKYRWDAAHAAHALQMNERRLHRRLQALGIGGTGAPGHPVWPQRTLQRSVVIHGQGLQSGVKTGMILSPLPPNSGILFGDIATGETVPAVAAYVESTGYATTLHRGLVTARTVEHIMAALHMYRITNALVKIGGEVPFMDGSARDFCRLIEEAGVAEQAAAAPLLPIRERHVWGREAADEKHFILEPAAGLTITYHLHYPAPIGRQEYTFRADSAAHFKATIAPARTFGFVKEIGQLHALGMANGGRLTNVILVDESRIINTDLRFPDEFVRHKVLDLLGDLYLTGKFVQGKISAYLTGHTENLALVKFLLTLSNER